MSEAADESTSSKLSRGMTSDGEILRTQSGAVLTDPNIIRERDKTVKVIFGSKWWWLMVLFSYG